MSEDTPTPEQANTAKLALLPSVWIWNTTYSDATRASTGVYATQALAERALREHAATLVRDVFADVDSTFEETEALPDPETATIQDLCHWCEMHTGHAEDVFEAPIVFSLPYEGTV